MSPFSQKIRSTWTSSFVALKIHCGFVSSVSKPASPSASRAGFASTCRTRTSMSRLVRGRPWTDDARPPIKTYGIPARSNAPTASARTRVTSSCVVFRSEATFPGYPGARRPELGSGTAADGGGAAPVLDVRDDPRRVAGPPGEIRPAFELSGLAGLPEAVLARGGQDRGARCDETGLLQRPPVLDRDHRAHDQGGDDEHPEHVFSRTCG